MSNLKQRTLITNDKLYIYILKRGLVGIIDNYICIEAGNGKKITIYDQYGNLIRILSVQVYHSCKAIYNGYFIYKSGIQMNVINIKTLEKTVWGNIAERSLLTCGYAWTKVYENKRQMIQLNPFTGKQINKFNISMGTTIDCIWLNGIFYHVYRGVGGRVLEYNGNRHIIKKYVYNNKYLILWDKNSIEFVGGKKYNMNIDQVYLTQKYIFVKESEHLKAFNFKMQLLFYINYLESPFQLLRDTFYIEDVNKLYTKITIRRYRPLLTKYIKNQTQNTHYKHILRLMI